MQAEAYYFLFRVLVPAFFIIIPFTTTPDSYISIASFYSVIVLSDLLNLVLFKIEPWSVIRSLLRLAVRLF